MNITFKVSHPDDHRWADQDLWENLHILASTDLGDDVSEDMLSWWVGPASSAGDAGVRGHVLPEGTVIIPFFEPYTIIRCIGLLYLPFSTEVHHPGIVTATMVVDRMMTA